MIDIYAKENRKEALQNIESLTTELKMLISQIQTVSRSKLEERLPDAERKVEECRLRYAILEEYYKILYNRDINNVKDYQAFTITYNALEREIQECAEAIFQSNAKLKYFYDALTTVAGKTKTGFDYFEGKFKEEYQENTRIWTESQSLKYYIENLNKESNNARVEELGDEPEF